MSFFLALFFLYGFGVTIALICAIREKDQYIKKYIDIEKKYKELLKKTQDNKDAPAEAVPVEAPVAAPAPKPLVQVPAQTAPTLPVYTRTESAPAPKKSNGLGAVGVSFAVGVLLMVIAAAVFISATWQTMLPGIKCVVLAAVVGVVYGLCAFSKKKLKLEKTASVLYMLGSLITPLAVVVGFLAFESQDTNIMLACCALSLGLTGLIGYKIFGSKLQVAISYAGFVWVDIFICMQALGNLEGFVLGICVAAFISGLIYFVKPDMKFFNYFAEITAYVAALGFLLGAGVMKAHMILVIVAHVLYFASILMLTKKRKIIKYFSAICPVYTMIFLTAFKLLGTPVVTAVVYIAVIALLFALYRVLKMDNPASNGIIVCILSYMMFAVADGGENSFLHYAALITPLLSCVAVIIMSKFQVEKKVYTYLIFFPAVMLCNEFMSSYVLMYVFLGVAVAAILASLKFKKIHIAIAAAATSFCTIIWAISVNHSDQHINTHVIINAAIVLALYAGVVFINKFKPVQKGAYIAARFPTLGLLILTNMVLMITIFNDKIEGFIALIVIDVLFEVITLKDTDNYFGALPTLTLFSAIVYKFAINDVSMMLAGALIILVFVVIGRIFINERIISKGRVDWFTFFAGAACLLPSAQMYRVTFLATFFILTFIGRFATADSVEEKVKSHLREILTAAVGAFAVSFAIVDVEITEGFDVEIRLLALLIGALVIFLAIRPGAYAKWIWFTTVAFALEVESLSSIGRETLLPITLVSLSGCGIFIYSFIAKKRSWFIVSIAVIAQFGVTLAITYWESKLWWIYLLILGAILITTASVNEYKRRRAIESGLEDKKIRLFDSWTW